MNRFVSKFSTLVMLSFFVPLVLLLAGFLAGGGAEGGGQSPCSEENARFFSADANNDGDVDISDAVYLLSFLFSGGEAPLCLAQSPDLCSACDDRFAAADHGHPELGTLGARIDALEARLAASEAQVPPGTTVAYGGETEPPGWLFCKGQALRSTDHPALFAAIGTAHGTGATDADPTTDFNLPDYRGRFLRGVDDTDPALGEVVRDVQRLEARTRMNPGGNDPEMGKPIAFQHLVGTVQSHAVRHHTHEYFDIFMTADRNNAGIGDGSLNGSYFPISISNSYGSAERDISGHEDNRAYQIIRETQGEHPGSIGGDETRPVNAYVYWIIKR